MYSGSLYDDRDPFHYKWVLNLWYYVEHVAFDLGWVYISFGIFRHPAWVVGSCSSGPSAAEGAETKSTGGFYRPEWSPCTWILSFLPMRDRSRTHFVLANTHTMLQKLSYFLNASLRRSFSWGTPLQYNWSNHPSVTLSCEVIEGEASNLRPIVIVHGMLGSSSTWISLARGANS